MDRTKFLDLGKQPIANGFLHQDQFDDEFFYSLSVGFDTESCLVTHMDYVKPELMFNDEYAYRGSMSKTMVKHFACFSDYIKGHLSPVNFARQPYSQAKVLEIGSNDGVFLKNWSPVSTFAVEPCGNFAAETNQQGYKTYNDFWNKDLSAKILVEQGPMDLVFAANCMCHIPDIDEAFSAVEQILSNDGLFIFEDPSLVDMINLNSYDQIYDEHPHIFSVTALQNILKRSGLTIVRVDNIKVHGGSNRIWAKRLTQAAPDDSVNRNLQLEQILQLDQIATFEKFADRVRQSKQDLVTFLSLCREHNQKVISYGATSKSTTIFNYCEIGTDLIRHITDTTPEKQNKYSPGVHIPIVPPEVGFDDTVDFAFLGAWNFADEIRNKEKNFKGKFITHVPVVRLV